MYIYYFIDEINKYTCSLRTGSVNICLLLLHFYVHECPFLQRSYSIIHFVCPYAKQWRRFHQFFFFLISIIMTFILFPSLSFFSIFFRPLNICLIHCVILSIHVFVCFTNYGCCNPCFLITFYLVNICDCKNTGMECRKTYLSNLSCILSETQHMIKNYHMVIEAQLLYNSLCHIVRQSVSPYKVIGEIRFYQLLFVTDGRILGI